MLKGPKHLIKLVTFDALHTIITPRQPTHEQYSKVFSPYVGELDSIKLKQSFRIALKEVQKELPSYNKGAENWWREVIQRTAIGAGADEKVLDVHLNEITRKLMKRFSSGEGYKVYDDTIATIARLREQTGIKTAVISNGDTRLREFTSINRFSTLKSATSGHVLQSLNLTNLFDTLILSEEQGVEKPSPKIFEKALKVINSQSMDGSGNYIVSSQCLHVGDELISDYQGASYVGWNALLLRRAGTAGEQEHREDGENLEQIQTISGLAGVIDWIKTGKV